MNEKRLRVAVVVADLFEAASAIVGAIGLVVGFMNIPVSVLEGSPFTDFTAPALILGFVVGGSALAAAVMAAFGPVRLGAFASAAAGSITVGWLTVEIAMIGFGSWAQAAYLLVGMAMIGLSGLWFLTEPADDVAGRRHLPA